MNRKQIKKCQKVLKRQTYSANHSYPLPPTPMKVYKRKYLVNEQEVSEEEFKKALIASRPCEQSLECLFAGIGGTINGTRFQIVYPE